MSPELKFQSKRATKNRYYLWICSVDGSSSHITILMHQPNQSQAMIKDVTGFSLNDTVITSMDYVRGRVLMPDSGNNSSGSNTMESEVDCVWLGTNARKIIVYGGNSPEQERQIAQLNVPDTPTQILYHNLGDKTFVALSNGDILMYHKECGDVWNLKHYHIIKLDESKLITSMMSINSNVYVACGRKIFVLSGSTGEIQKNFEISQESNDVNLMAHAGVGLWISLKNSSIICLYHMETFKHLQDINIAHNILRVTSKSETPSNNSLSTVYVTALMACKGLLWVGTNVGFTLTVPLPRLEGLPIISGNINISYHAHLGPVTFFLPLITKTAANQTVLPLKTTTKSTEPVEVEQNNNINNNINNISSKNGEHIEKEDVIKLEKQRSLDVHPSPAKLKNLPNSPIVLRRKSNIRDSDLSRISKTLPRGFSGIGNFLNLTSTSMRSSSSSGSSANGSDIGCDVYGLYSDLLFVKEDFDGQMTLTPMTAMSLHDQNYESLRRGSSDPDLAAIPSKVSTLDRRLKMKTGRPRSLDLSNWSVDSRSSSLFSSSGSEESMGVKYRSVSRNSSNASASQKFNGGDLVNINEYEHHPVQQCTSTPAKEDVKESVPNGGFSTATMKTIKRKNGKNNLHQQLVDGRRTILTLMGGRGYVNWRHIWYSSPVSSTGSSSHSSSTNMERDGRHQSFHMRSSSVTMPKSQYSTEGHIIIWEKKL
jgi:Rho guanine nucleotide exchange factor 10